MPLTAADRVWRVCVCVGGGGGVGGGVVREMGGVG